MLAKEHQLQLPLGNTWKQPGTGKKHGKKVDINYSISTEDYLRE